MVPTYMNIISTCFIGNSLNKKLIIQQEYLKSNLFLLWDALNELSGNHGNLLVIMEIMEILWKSWKSHGNLGILESSVHNFYQ